jgi:hypothetical protein
MKSIKSYPKFFGKKNYKYFWVNVLWNICFRNTSTLIEAVNSAILFRENEILKDVPQIRDRSIILPHFGNKTSTVRS